jgi:hypothetical protein
VSRPHGCGREASWQQGDAPIVGPETPAAWGGSEQERENAAFLDRWSRHLNKALWGEE